MHKVKNVMAWEPLHLARKTKFSSIILQWQK